MLSARSIVGSTLVAVLVMAGSVLLQAHMAFEKSEPAADAILDAPPPHVQLFFTQAPDVAVSRLEIKGPSDKTTLVKLHAMGKSLMAMVEGDMPDGAYTLLWQTAGDDGHVQKGEVAFTMKRK